MRQTVIIVKIFKISLDISIGIELKSRPRGMMSFIIQVMMRENRKCDYNHKVS